MEIKLSKDAEKAVKMLQDIEKKLIEFQKVYDTLDPKECNLIGGFVVGIYSPVGRIGIIGNVGSPTICEGLISRLSSKETRLLSMLGARNLPEKKSA